MGANNSLPAVYDTPGYSVMIVDLILTTATLAARMTSRKLMKASPAPDDYLSCIAYFSNLGLLIAGLLLTSSGALNLSKLSKQTAQQKRDIKSTYLALAILYVTSITFIKMSIIFMYRRCFTMLTRWFRYGWWFTLVLTLLWMTTCFTLLSLQATGKIGRRGFSRLGISITGVINAFTDILILGLPAFMISQMKLARRQKIALISIFLIGGIASIVSLIRGTIFFINRAHELNEAYSNYLDIVLTATESSAGLMCACLPLCKPLVAAVTKWIQKWRGLNTEHQGWTTVANSQNATLQGTTEQEPRTITRVDEYEIKLLATTQSMERISRDGKWPQQAQRPWDGLSNGKI